MSQQFKKWEKALEKANAAKAAPLTPPRKKLPFPFITFALAPATVFWQKWHKFERRLTVMDILLSHSSPLVNTLDSFCRAAAQFNQSAAANGLSAVRSSVAGIRERTVRSTAEPVAELGR